MASSSSVRLGLVTLISTALSGVLHFTSTGFSICMNFSSLSGDSISVISIVSDGSSGIFSMGCIISEIIFKIFIATHGTSC